MKLTILKTRGEITPHLETVSAAADTHRDSLGFLPKSAYEDQAEQGKLWVAEAPGGRFAGHLIFGGVFPTLKVIQIFVEPSFRRKGVGERLLTSLVEFGEEHQFLSITARVAADLEANKFWEKLGFHLVRQVQGGVTTGRLINIRARNLDVPTLFDLAEPAFRRQRTSELEFRSLPTISNPRYALDLNILIDIIKGRPRAPGARAILRSAFNNFTQLVATTELRREVLRAEGAGEPLLELISNLPVLPSVAGEHLAGLIEDLRRIVFPDRDLTRKAAAQDQSDLAHLALCIHHRITGFITGETALLRAGRVIASGYGLEVLSPEDFLEVEETPLGLPAYLEAALAEVTLTIERFSEGNRDEIERFLAEVGIDAEVASRVWEPTVRGAKRERLCGRSGSELVAIAAWDVPPVFRPEVHLFLYVDERASNFVRFVDHVLEKVSLQQPHHQVRRIILHHGLLQSVTRRTALERGFRANPHRSEPEPSLVKVAVPGIVRARDWPRIRNGFRELSQLILPETMPSFGEVQSDGLSIISQHGEPASRVTPFEFDTIISPGICLYPGQTGVVTPIRQAYADVLLGGVQVQQSFLAKEEALLRLERAFFRSPRRSSKFEKGMPLFFYISGHRGGLKAMAACARITSSAVLSLEQVRTQYSRQGVLPDHELQRIFTQHGNIHVVTFDNLLPFRNLVSFEALNEMACVSGARFVTAETVQYQQMELILDLALPRSSANR